MITIHDVLPGDFVYYVSVTRGKQFPKQGYFCKGRDISSGRTAIVIAVERLLITVLDDEGVITFSLEDLFRSNVNIKKRFLRCVHLCPRCGIMNYGCVPD